MVTILAQVLHPLLWGLCRLIALGGEVRGYPGNCDSRGAFLPFPAVLELHIRSHVLKRPRGFSLHPTPDRGPLRGWPAGGRIILLL